MESISPFVVFGIIICVIIARTFKVFSSKEEQQEESSNKGNDASCSIEPEKFGLNAQKVMPEILKSLQCKSEEYVYDENRQKNFMYNYQGFNLIIYTLPNNSKYQLNLLGFLDSKPEHRGLISELCNHYNRQGDPKVIFGIKDDESIEVSIQSSMQATGVMDYDTKNLENEMFTMFQCVNSFRSAFQHYTSDEEKQERVPIRGFAKPEG